MTRAMSIAIAFTMAITVVQAGAATTTAYSLIKPNHYCLRGGRVIMWTQRRSGGGKEASRSQAVLECASAVLADTECSSTFLAQVGECYCMTSGTSCEEASNRKELQGLSIYTAKATTPATQAPNNVVAVTVSLNNIHFDRMNDEAHIQVKTKLLDSIKRGFLDTLSGYTTQDLTVGLTNGMAGFDNLGNTLGSVVANVKITPKIGADSYALKNVVTEELFNIQTAVITNVKAISNVNMILPNEKTAADITATASNPREVVTGKGSASASMAVVMSANTLVIVCLLAF